MGTDELERIKQRIEKLKEDTVEVKGELDKLSMYADDPINFDEAFQELWHAEVAFGTALDIIEEI